MTFFIQLVATGFSLGMVYALVAIGFVIILKCSRAFNIAQGHFVLIGGYLGYTFLVTFHLPLWAALLLAIATAAALGLLIERLALRPLVGQSELSHDHDDHSPGDRARRARHDDLGRGI